MKCRISKLFRENAEQQVASIATAPQSKPRLRSYVCTYLCCVCIFLSSQFTVVPIYPVCFHPYLCCSTCLYSTVFIMLSYRGRALWISEQMKSDACITEVQTLTGHNLEICTVSTIYGSSMFISKPVVLAVGNRTATRSRIYAHRSYFTLWMYSG